MQQTTSPESTSPTLLLGDCREQMRTLADNSIDSICTDPPYGLAFMGADFDTFHAEGKSDNLAFQESMTSIFAEALRVAKPGAHLLAFGGTRTYHRLACSIEDAGWEIRDCIMWVYGSGFPKSMDVSKAIDKALGAERTEVIGHENTPDMRGGNLMASQGKARLTRDITAPATPEATAWNGWGTCLKPAVEPIVVARKPLEGTVAANVLKYGTGAINIDACRVPTGSERVIVHDAPVGSFAGGEQGRGSSRNNDGNIVYKEVTGRFPANLIHDGSPEVLDCFPDSKGQCGAVKGTEPSRTGSNGIYGNYNRQHTMSPRGDSGSAARFFYCAKASRSERGEGNDHVTVKPLALMRWLITLVTPPGGTVLDPFMGSGTTGVAARQLDRPFVGIERDPHYFEIAKSRVLGELPPVDPPKSKSKTPRAPTNPDGRTAFDLSPAPTPQSDGTPATPKPVQETLF